jgi:hypothetical protein
MDRQRGSKETRAVTTRRCTAVAGSQSKKAESAEGWIAGLVKRLHEPLCEEPAVANTTLGYKCQKHLDQFRLDMADPHTLFNVLAGRARTASEIEAMIHFLN